MINPRTMPGFHACPPPIARLLERLWTGELRPRVFLYALAHHIASNMHEYACLLLPDTGDPQKLQAVVLRNLQRRDALRDAAETLRKGDPTLSLDKRAVKSEGDRALAAKVEAYAKQQFGAEWRDTGRDRQGVMR